LIEAAAKRRDDDDRRGCMVAWMSEYFARQKRLNPLSFYESQFFGRRDPQAAIEEKAEKARAHFTRLKATAEAKGKKSGIVIDG